MFDVMHERARALTLARANTHTLAHIHTQTHTQTHYFLNRVPIIEKKYTQKSHTRDT